MNRTIDQIASDVVENATAWATESRLIGNVTALELVRLAAPHVLSCPVCESEAFVGIDCYLCMAVHAAEKSGDREVERG